MALTQAYAGKKVLVTGHTGFKGSWLTTWLLKLGSHVIGLSKDIPTKPALFEVLGLQHRISHHVANVCDLASVRGILEAERPDFVVHLAAQAIVSQSYTDPIETFLTNTVGTMNVLEALRAANWPCVAVLITSDKCYDNVEWVWGYRETDKLGGRDIYSGSKGAAELVIRSYVASFFTKPVDSVRIAVGRAGNVIGGGDWARDRIVADCMRAWSEGGTVETRSPRATRPWQHVLEPLSGYLALGEALAKAPDLHGEAFNFGPRSDQDRTVSELIGQLAQNWGYDSTRNVVRNVAAPSFHEAGLLKLNCDKARYHLRWEPTLEFDETLRLVSDWYSGYYQRNDDMYSLTLGQIEEYERTAHARGRRWANGR